jgi:hypothetical protein
MMKKLYSILAVLAAAALLWLGWQWLDGRRQPPLDEPSVISWMGDPPTKVENEPVKIFQRAFWASPTGDDRILHAERREWSNAEGTQKWQWFLVVKPSPTLIKRLRDDNAFGLTAAPSAADIANAPQWFAFDASESVVMKSPVSNMQLIFSKDGKSLHATDSGLGFRPGAPEPAKPAPPPSAPAPGRLPMTPPPTSKP